VLRADSIDLRPPTADGRNSISCDNPFAYNISVDDPIYCCAYPNCVASCYLLFHATVVDGCADPNGITTEERCRRYVVVTRLIEQSIGGLTAINIKVVTGIYIYIYIYIYLYIYIYILWGAVV